MAKSDKQTTTGTQSTTGKTTSTGTSTGTSNTNMQNGPLADQLPYYQQLWQQAQEAFGKTNDQPGYVGPTQAQTDAVGMVKAAVPGMSTGVQDIRDLATSTLRGDWLNPATNPFIAQNAQAALNPVQQAFDANKLAVQDRAIMQGAYGGARQDLQENQLVDQFSRTAGDITNSMYFNNYNAERERMGQAPGLLDAANILSLAGPTALAGVGSLEQGWGQAKRDDELAAPWRGTAELANILGAGGFGSTTGTTTSTGTTTNTGKTTGKGTSTDVTEKDKNMFASMLQGLMGGGMTGASLASGIGGVAAGAGLGAFAPWMLPFAALGGLAGAL